MILLNYLKKVMRQFVFAIYLYTLVRPENVRLKFHDTESSQIDGA